MIRKIVWYPEAQKYLVVQEHLIPGQARTELKGNLVFRAWSGSDWPEPDADSAEDLP